MLQVGSALTGYTIEASDGTIGTVSDFLFDDRSWRVRWLVVDTGGWLTGRLVLIRPRAIDRTDYVRRVLAVALTKAQVEASPDIGRDQPVSRQMESNVCEYYGWDPVWGSSFYGEDIIASGIAPPPFGTPNRRADMDPAEGDDPHLRSLSAVTGYDIQASDGAIGHLENLLIDDTAWNIRYLIVDTKNWWFGQHVLISPYAVREISWSREQIFLGVSREKVKASPPWTPLDLIDQAYEKRLHSYYDWPGYGW